MYIDVYSVACGSQPNQTGSIVSGLVGLRLMPKSADENLAAMRAQDNLECLPASHMNVVREVLMAKIMEESTPAKRPRVTNPQLLLFKAS